MPNIKLFASVDVDLDDFAFSVSNLGNETVKGFIMSIDEAMCDESFTVDVIKDLLVTYLPASRLLEVRDYIDKITVGGLAHWSNGHEKK
ncbi:hypothetical protein UFOVP150_44 [uncultured Caudovirales phage]|uniref:Uncharacterized protein n=1 Tax=uncultured Caudovirales phage TaxID=2100421 RepID=A0A6J7W835_9CAUD|nr:hypothetical protein UFOVP150_44 [uncultured Caudovirales phage]